MNATTFSFQDVDTKKVLQSISTTNTSKPGAWEIGFNDGMPILGIPMKPNPIEETPLTAFLSIFRCYRFQVSRTFNGQGDMGSTIVATDMWRLTELGELGAKCLTEMASAAIMKAGCTIPMDKYANLDAYISLCYDYLKDNAHIFKAIYG